MKLNEEVETLRRMPLFSGIAPARLKLLAFSSERLRYSPGQVLFNQGDTGDAAYVVLSGSADILVNSPSGEIKVATAESNTIVGELAIICDVGRTATVKANSPLETIRIRRDLFLNLVCEFPEMAVQIMRQLGNQLIRTTAELTECRSRAARRTN
jgi:CRP-like cAMP-binding protein